MVNTYKNMTDIQMLHNKVEVAVAVEHTHDAIGDGRQKLIAEIINMIYDLKIEELKEINKIIHTTFQSEA